LSTYQANTSEAYNIIRIGRLLRRVTKFYGRDTVLVLETLASLGFATVHVLQTHVIEYSGMSVDRFKNSICELSLGPFLRVARKANFQSPYDARRDVELTITPPELPSSTSAKKAKYDMDGKVDAEYEKRTDSTVNALEILKQLGKPPSPVRDFISWLSVLADTYRTIHFSRLISINI
jgi:hypothetical protein